MSLLTKIKSLFKRKQYCGFCKKAQDEVRTLIVGPPAPNNKNHHTGICDECSSRLVNMLKEKDIKKIDNRKQGINKKIYCNFCGKDFGKTKQMFRNPDFKAHPYICNECVKICGAIAKDK